MSGVVSDKKLTSVSLFQVQFLPFEQQRNFHSFSDHIAMMIMKWEILLALASLLVPKLVPVQEGVTYAESREYLFLGRITLSMDSYFHISNSSKRT